jgi:predicted nucleic acid-binding protein
MIFIDSDAYIAIYSDDDFHNTNSIAISKSLDANKEELVTSWDVVDEVATKLSRYGTKKLALKFINKLLKSETLIIFPDGKMLKSSIRIFRKQTSKRVSFTDCTNMAIAKSRNIKTFFSFDRHYVKNGFKLLKGK